MTARGLRKWRPELPSQRGGQLHGCARPKYGRAVLEPVVATSTTLAEVIRRFGLPPTGGNYRMFKALIRRVGIDMSHFGRSSFRARIAALDCGALADLVRDATSMAGVLTQLGMPRVGRAHHELRRRLRELGIDVSHLRGQGWARGETRKTHPSVDRHSSQRQIPDELVFMERSLLVRGPSIVKRLLTMGWRYECVICGIVEWQSRRLTLHLDHINGIHDDNRLSNLRLLCPNCHSQTDTYSNRRRA